MFIKAEQFEEIINDAFGGNIGNFFDNEDINSELINIKDNVREGEIEKVELKENQRKATNKSHFVETYRTTQLKKI